YPMLGMLLFRLTAFVQKHDGRVKVVGADQLSDAPGLPPLIDGDKFDRRWFATEQEANRVSVEGAERGGLDELREQLRKNDVDVIVVFPPDFAAQMEQMRDELAQPAEMRAVERRRPPPKAIVYSNSNRDTSLVTHAIVSRVLRLWQEKIVEETLARGHVPLEVTQPFVLEPQDVSASEPRQALWSKLLPLVMFVWALTGAFYP